MRANDATTRDGKPPRHAFLFSWSENFGIAIEIFERARAFVLWHVRWIPRVPRRAQHFARHVVLVIELVHPLVKLVTVAQPSRAHVVRKVVSLLRLISQNHARLWRPRRFPLTANRRIRVPGVVRIRVKPKVQPLLRLSTRRRRTRLRDSPQRAVLDLVVIHRIIRAQHVRHPWLIRGRRQRRPHRPRQRLQLPRSLHVVGDVNFHKPQMSALDQLFPHRSKVSLELFAPIVIARVLRQLPLSSPLHVRLQRLEQRPSRRRVSP